MLDQLLDSVRKATESSFQIQQDMLKHWSQQWLLAPSAAAGASTEWGRAFQKRWFEFAIEMMNKHRESLDATYKMGIEVLEQTLHATEAKSPEEQRRIAEELWRKVLDTVKAQNETQFQDFQKWTERSFEFAQGAPPA
jgi:hypothetical protein